MIEREATRYVLRKHGCSSVHVDPRCCASAHLDAVENGVLLEANGRLVEDGVARAAQMTSQEMQVNNFAARLSEAAAAYTQIVLYVNRICNHKHARTHKRWPTRGGRSALPGRWRVH